MTGENVGIVVEVGNGDDENGELHSGIVVNVSEEVRHNYALVACRDNRDVRYIQPRLGLRCDVLHSERGRAIARETDDGDEPIRRRCVDTRGDSEIGIVSRQADVHDGGRGGRCADVERSSGEGEKELGDEGCASIRRPIRGGDEGGGGVRRTDYLPVSTPFGEHYSTYAEGMGTYHAL